VKEKAPTGASPLGLPAPSEAELQALRESIAAHGGVLTPIVVSAGPANAGEVADGRARLAICAELGLECPREERTFASELAFAHFRLTTNLVRRKLPDALRIRYGLELEPLERALAAERKAQAKGAPRGQKALPVALPEAKGETRERVARLVGLKPSTYARGAKVLREGSPELVVRFEAGEETVNSAYRRLQHELRRDEKRALAQALRANPLPPPDGRYAVVVIDPPWPYENLPYPSMSLEEIAALPTLELLTEDAVVWLWTTDRFMKDALVIATERWGLELRKIVVWDKVRAGRPTPWLRGQTEYCLLLTRGNPPFEPGNLTNLLCELAREHSRKPETFYELVRDTCPAQPRLEMFAREERDGFEPWGAEVDFFSGWEGDGS
jgi:N6-adenosine-specific RNA methylase IME4/ParB-like chromosome segregation protein Spo0J